MKVCKFVIQIILAIILSLLGFEKSNAQQHYASSQDDRHSVQRTGNAATIPSLQAIHAESSEKIELDGKLNEAVWQHSPVATGFIQRSPRDGHRATEKTTARVIYTNEAIYVGIKAYDAAMDSVAATLFRRDGSAYSDWVYASFDSYDDNRTSFNFAVNPKGVQKDILIFDNDSEDIRWDAVWEAETKINADNWTVEMRIPLSQLRYSTSQGKQSWGVNFQRRIARKEEIAFWAPIPQDAAGIVSQYGELRGLTELKKPERLELIPYVSSSLTRAPSEPTNPFYEANDLNASVGGNLKYGLTSDVTLTATINPDFGQVEADPAVINLSAFETYLEAQRPFFLEGTEIFQFGNTQTFNRFGNPIVFYSRRIGRQPQGSVYAAGVEAQHVDQPDQTSIAGAAKVSGKMDNGLSFGILNAFTTREQAVYTSPGASTAQSIAVEPPTNYFVSRLKKDFNKGKTIVGGYFSSVNRFMDTEYLISELHEDSYIGGVDFEHSWKNREWIVSGVFSGSHVSGSQEAILQTQLSSSRYFNRPDAHYLSVDPQRTSLSGFAGEFSAGRFGGDHWRGSITYSTVSPGYEVNDIGFETSADYHGLSSLLQYRETQPAAPFRFYNINVYTNQQWNYGGDLTYNGIATSGNMDFSNLWSFAFNVTYNGKAYEDRLLRGGPQALSPARIQYSGVLQTNASKKISAEIGHMRVNDMSGGMLRDVYMDLTFRPTSYIQVTISPNYNYQTNTGQYVRAVDDPTASHTYGTRYVFADIDQKTLSAGFRLDWTFSPEISLQTYIRPFITSGNYYNYKEFTTPRAYNFEVYGEDAGTINQKDNTYFIDPDASGPAETFSILNGDFNFRSIQTNAVFRWEYSPGSTLFLVWQQDRRSSERFSNLQFSRDFNRLWHSEPTNIFLIKLSYWLSR